MQAKFLNYKNQIVHEVEINNALTPPGVISYAGRFFNLRKVVQKPKNPDKHQTLLYRECQCVVLVLEKSKFEVYKQEECLFVPEIQSKGRQVS